MSAVVVIIVLVVIFLLVGIGIIFTWSWWKRWLNRCLATGDSAPDARFEPATGPATFHQLDPSSLERPRNRNGSVTIETLPNLRDLNIDPRQSFELRNTRYPQGIIPAEQDSSSIHAYDWFHPPYESFPRENLEYFKILGKGWFGTVIEAEAKNILPITKIKKVIVKKMRDDANELEQMRFLNQSRVYRDSNHGNILKLLGHCVDNNLPYLGIYEYWPLGDLKSYLIAKKKCGEAGAMIQQGVISRMAVDIGKALEYLLALGFIHEDLSARNCMVGNVAGKIIMGDYGMAPNNYPRDYYKISNLIIPIRWSAPEAFEFQEGTCIPLPVTGAANIWTYGVVLSELYEFGKQPYDEMRDEEVIQRVLVSKSYLMEPPTIPFVQDSTKDRLYKLMLSCWNTTPENRPNIQQILEIMSSP